MKEKNRLAVILPGIGYHKGKPLLYYATKLVKAKGYKVICIDYSGMPKDIKGDAAKMRMAAKIACEQTKEQLKETDFGIYEEILFIAKSIGTVAAAKYVGDHSIEAKQIWYTPVEATFSVEAKNAIAFIGEADPWSDVSKLKLMASECGIKMYSYPDGNHSLECGNIGKDIAVLEEVMEITESYVPVCRG